MFGKVMKQLILETISRYIKEKKLFVSSQHKFTKSSHEKLTKGSARFCTGGEIVSCIIGLLRAGQLDHRFSEKDLGVPLRKRRLMAS